MPWAYTARLEWYLLCLSQGVSDLGVLTVGMGEVHCHPMQRLMAVSCLCVGPAFRNIPKAPCANSPAAVSLNCRPLIAPHYGCPMTPPLSQTQEQVCLDAMTEHEEMKDSVNCGQKYLTSEQVLKLQYLMITRKGPWEGLCTKVSLVSYEFLKIRHKLQRKRN